MAGPKSRWPLAAGEDAGAFQAPLFIFEIILSAQALRDLLRPSYEAAITSPSSSGGVPSSILVWLNRYSQSPILRLLKDHGLEFSRGLLFFVHSTTSCLR